MTSLILSKCNICSYHHQSSSMMKHKSQHRPVLNYNVDKHIYYQLLSEASLYRDLSVVAHDASIEC